MRTLLTAVGVLLLYGGLTAVSSAEAAALRRCPPGARSGHLVASVLTDVVAGKPGMLHGRWRQTLVVCNTWTGARRIVQRSLNTWTIDVQNKHGRLSWLVPNEQSNGGGVLWTAGLYGGRPRRLGDARRAITLRGGDLVWYGWSGIFRYHPGRAIQRLSREVGGEDFRLSKDGKELLWTETDTGEGQSMSLSLLPSRMVGGCPIGGGYEVTLSNPFAFIAEDANGTAVACLKHRGVHKPFVVASGHVSGYEESSHGYVTAMLGPWVVITGGYGNRNATYYTVELVDLRAPKRRGVHAWVEEDFGYPLAPDMINPDIIPKAKGLVITDDGMPAWLLDVDNDPAHQRVLTVVNEKLTLLRLVPTGTQLALDGRVLLLKQPDGSQERVDPPPSLQPPE